LKRKNVPVSIRGSAARPDRRDDAERGGGKEDDVEVIGGGRLSHATKLEATRTIRGGKKSMPQQKEKGIDAFEQTSARGQRENSGCPYLRLREGRGELVQRPLPDIWKKPTLRCENHESMTRNVTLTQVSA